MPSAFRLQYILREDHLIFVAGDPLYEPSPEHSQPSRCRLLTLPRELRDEIYAWVLASTRITFGAKLEGNRSIEPTINKSRPCSLALLYTCKQIKGEIGLLWIGWVLFNFHSPESLLDILTGLPTTQVASIRHVRVNGRPVMLSLPHDDVYYRLAWTLKLVSHLQLDTLTVLGGSASNISGGPGQVDYNTLDDLIAFGTGWKELQYITPNASILSFPKIERFGQTYLRKPQPDAWRSVLYQRDGPESGASVIIYRSRAPVPGSILNCRQRETFEQTIVQPQLEEFGLAKDPFLDSSSEQCKELLVVVKRGRDANIIEQVPKPPHDRNPDIRALALNMTWSQIRENYAKGGADEDEDIFGDSTLPRVMSTLDTYGRNAYEISWADSRDPDIAAGGGQSDDWSEHTAANLYRSRFVDL